MFSRGAGSGGGARDGTHLAVSVGRAVERGQLVDRHLGRVAVLLPGRRVGAVAHGSHALLVLVVAVLVAGENHPHQAALGDLVHSARAACGKTERCHLATELREWKNPR